jgi:hypothetical protein
MAKQMLLLLLLAPGSAPGSIKHTQLLLVVSSAPTNDTLAVAAAAGARQDTWLHQVPPGCSYSVAGPSSSALVRTSPPPST